MKKLLLPVALSTFLSMSFAQDVVPSLAGGSKAVLFSFGGLSFLSAGTFDGGIGARYYISDALAVRAGIQFTSASQTNPANPVAPNTGEDGKASASAVGFSGAAEWHMGKARVIPYVGAGFSFTTTSTEAKNAVTGNPPPAQTTTKNRAAGETVNGVTYVGGSSFQVFGMLGVEFFLYKEVSLAAEYRLGYMSTSRADQEVTSGTTTTITKIGSGSTFGISNSGSLTLAVYLP
jgi:outer membrane protein W